MDNPSEFRVAVHRAPFRLDVTVLCLQTEFKTELKEINPLSPLLEPGIGRNFRTRCSAA
jgi:hypothetical protein